jgi:hypothetical protein
MVGFSDLAVPEGRGDANQAEAAAVSEATTTAGRAAATAAGSLRMISMARASRWMWASGHNGEIRRAVHGYEPDARGGDGAVVKSWGSGVVNGSLMAPEYNALTGRGLLRPQEP